MYTSHPFKISDDLYSRMKFDALAYFYHNRSGDPIEAQYVGELYARESGPDDTGIPCFTGWSMDKHYWGNCICSSS